MGSLAYQSSIGSDIDYQISYVIRYTSIHFTPDPIGDLVFNGVASNVFHSSFSNGLQGDGSYHLNDCHTIRMGFSASDENTHKQQYLHGFPGGSTETLPVRLSRSRTTARRTATPRGVYLQDEWKPFDKLTVNYGLRFD